MIANDGRRVRTPKAGDVVMIADGERHGKPVWVHRTVKLVGPGRLVVAGVRAWQGIECDLFHYGISWKYPEDMDPARDFDGEQLDEQLGHLYLRSQRD